MATEDLSPFNKLKPKQQNFVIFTNSIIKKLTETELNFDELIENYEEYNEVEFKKSLKKDDDDFKDFNITFVYAAYQYIKKINAKIEPMEILEHALNYDAKKAKNLLKKDGLITPVKRAATKSKVTPEIKSAEEHLEEVIENENNDDSNNKKNDTKNKKKASSKKTEESPTTPPPPKKSSKPAAVAAAAPKAAAAAKKVAAPKDDKKEHSPSSTKTTANVKKTDTKLKNQKKQLSSPEKTDNKNIVETKPTKLEKKQSTKKPVKLQEIKQKLNFDSDSGDESDDDDNDDNNSNNNSQKTSPLKAENNQKISADSDNETENEAEEAEETDDDDANSTDSNNETDSDNEK